MLPLPDLRYDATTFSLRVTSAPVNTSPEPTRSAAAPRSPAASWYARLALVAACAYFAQLYTTLKPSYLDLHAYALGQERMPFQARELMRFPLLWAARSPLLQRATAGKTVIASPERLASELLSFTCLLLAGVAAIKLYKFTSPRRQLALLPFAVLIVLCLFDFYLAVPFSFPYDLPATMFLGWGSYFVLTGQFGWLLPVFVLGTWNRETTLFLILLLAVVACTRTGEFRLSSLRGRDGIRLATLTVVWLLILVALHHRYAANPSEAGSRWRSNLTALAHPLLWPNILSASAFLLPWLWLRRRDLPPPLRAGMLVLPLWVLLLLSVGQILELRIYGDISVFVAVCAASLFSADTLAPNLLPAPRLTTDRSHSLKDHAREGPLGS